MLPAWRESLPCQADANQLRPAGTGFNAIAPVEVAMEIKADLPRAWVALVRAFVVHL